MKDKKVIDSSLVENLRFEPGIGMIRLITLPHFLSDYGDTQCRSCFDCCVLTAARVLPNITFPCCETCFRNKRIDVKIKAALPTQEICNDRTDQDNVIDLSQAKERKVKA